MGVNGFQVRGNVRLADVKLYEELPMTLYGNSAYALSASWSVGDQTPPDATVDRVYDVDLQRFVVETSGDWLYNRYDLSDEDGFDWNNSTQLYGSVLMKSSEHRRMFWKVLTDAGERYLVYDTRYTTNTVSGVEIWIGIGADFRDNLWHNHIFDLQLDLSTVLQESGYSDETILGVNGFQVRGSVRLIDIKLHR